SAPAEIEPYPIAYFSAPNALPELLTIELIVSGELDRMAQRSSWRVAASHDVDSPPDADEEAGFVEHSGFDRAQLSDSLGQLGRDENWLRERISMETIYHRVCEALLSRQARAREIAALRLPLTRFDLETIELDSLDAARDALRCARHFSMSMEEVAS